MLFKKTNPAKKEIEDLFHEVQINLENNYKDLARTALKEYQELVEQYRSSGELKEKDYGKYKQIVDEYEMRMQNYHH